MSNLQIGENIVGFPKNHVLAVLLITTLIAVPSFVALNTFEVGQTDAVFIESAETVEEESTVVAYESLSEQEQQSFRQEQGEIYDSEGAVTLTTDASLYQNIDYISLDGEYYELSTEQTTRGIGTVFVILISVSGMFSVLSAGMVAIELSSLGVAQALRKSVGVIDKEKTAEVFSAVTVIVVLIGLLFGVATAPETLIAEQVSEDTIETQGAVEYTELSQTQQDEFSELVSGGWVFNQESDFSAGTIVQSDGEYYQTTPELILPSVIVNALYDAFLALLVWTAIKAFAFHTLNQKPQKVDQQSAA